MLPPAMRGGALNTRGIFLLAALLAGLLLAAGCGGSSGSSGDEITVETGSLSKAKFIAKADAICEGARTEFLQKYTSFVEAHKADLGDKQKEEALLGEMLETILGPNLEGQIKQISHLGAPKDYAPQVEAFLSALQQRIDEAQGNPVELTATATPFKKAEDAARKAGMNGCAESLS